MFGNFQIKSTFISLQIVPAFFNKSRISLKYFLMLFSWGVVFRRLE